MRKDRELPTSPLVRLAKRQAQWLGDGTEAGGIAVSARIRLARNLTGRLFPGRAGKVERREVLDAALEGALSVPALEKGLALRLEKLDDLERQVLMERRLISPAQCQEPAGGGVVVSRDEHCSVMINEEDHLRSQVMGAGCCLDRLWDEADRLDSLLAERFTFAFSGELGFLTSCPTNVGTGLRASVMLHLPALAFDRQIEAVERAISRIGFAVRGAFGEESVAAGNLYQVSNQSTLGDSEGEILGRLKTVVQQVISHERNARKLLLERQPSRFHDLVGRAYGVLRHSYSLCSKEGLELLSSLRLGVALGMFKTLDAATVDELQLAILPGHLQIRAGGRLDDSERDELRARLVRARLAHFESSPDAGDPAEN